VLKKVDQMAEWKNVTDNELAAMKGIVAAAAEGDKRDAPEPGTSRSSMNAKVHPEVLRSYKSHLKAVRGITVIHESLFTASQDGSIIKWDLTTGEPLGTMQGHRDWVTCLASSEESLFSGSCDQTARKWNEVGECSLVFVGHTKAVWSVAAVVPGELLTSSADTTARQWESDSGKCMRVMRGHDGCVWSIASSPDGTAYTGSEDCTIRVWGHDGSMEGGIQGVSDGILGGNKAGVLDVATTPHRLVSGAGDGIVMVWELGTWDCLVIIEAHQGPVTSLSAFGNTIVSGGCDRCARQWSLDTGRHTFTYRGHSDEVTALYVHQRLLFTASDTGAVNQYYLVGEDTKGEVQDKPGSSSASLPPKRSRAELDKEIHDLKKDLELHQLRAKAHPEVGRKKADVEAKSAAAGLTILGAEVALNSSSCLRKFLTTSPLARAASLVQAYLKGRKARRLVGREYSATVVQAGVRGHEGRKLFHQHYCATVIQAAIRGKAARKQVAGMNLDHIKFSSMWRRSHFETLRMRHEMLRNEEETLHNKVGTLREQMAKQELLGVEYDRDGDGFVDHTEWHDGHHEGSPEEQHLSTKDGMKLQVLTEMKVSQPHRMSRPV